MKQTSITLTRETFSDETVERLIKEQHAAAMIQAVHLANQHALANKSLVKGALHVLTEPINAIYNGLLARVDSILQGKLQLRTGSAEKQEVEGENTELQKKVYDLEAELKQTDQPVESHNFLMLFVRVIAALFLVFFITGAEWQFLARSLQVMTQNRAAANQLGLGIALAMPILIHFGEFLIQKYIKTLHMRRVWRVALSILLLLAFVALGYIRQQFHETDEEAHRISVLHFVAVNLFLNLAATFVIEVMIAPAIAKFKEALKERQAIKKVTDLKAEIQKTKDRIATNTTALHVALKHKASVVAYHKAVENRVAAHYAESLAEYKKILILKANNSGIPDCFSDIPAPLTFYAPEIQL